jgi:hypothetical protein
MSKLAMTDDWSAEETDDPLYADRRNFYNSLDKARRIFERTIKHGPCIRLTIRQRMSVLDQWPKG